MQTKFRPMLACQCKDIKQLKYPMLATPKIDGIRCHTTRYPEHNNKVRGLSRSGKLIRNLYIQLFLENYNMTCLDGELTVGDNFQTSTSGIMSESGQPNFTFHVFDVVCGKQETYLERVSYLKHYLKYKENFRVKYLIPTLIPDERHLLAYEEEQLRKGYEGVMLRTPESPYKNGRSTWKEQYLVKIKRFQDDEATVIGFVEKMHNDNVQEVDALGYSKRSTHKENMVPTGVLGALRVRNERGMEFNVGSGFNDAQREEIWKDRSSFLNRTIKYKYQPHGVKELPRCPVFLGFRDSRDSSNNSESNNQTQLSFL